LGIPETVSDALGRASEDVSVRSEAEAMAVAGGWNGSPPEAGDASDEFGSRIPDLDSAGWAAVSEDIFRVDDLPPSTDGEQPDPSAIERDDLRVSHAEELRRSTQRDTLDAVVIDALAPEWLPLSTEGDVEILSEELPDFTERPTDPMLSDPLMRAETRASNDATSLSPSNKPER
jgi:hypothetical protein